MKRSAARVESPDAATAASLSGKFGRFRILRRLGQGGMGTVLLAYDTLLERKIALKLLQPRWQRVGADARRTRIANVERRLKREARFLAQLDHPNIVEVLDIGVLHGVVFIALEYVQGQTLAAWANARPRTWQEICAIMLQIGSALSAAHDKGVIHRDFKPENVMVDEHGNATVIDFGIALDESLPNPARDEAEVARIAAHRSMPVITSRTRLTSRGRVVGTPAYMAPEQSVGGPCDAKVDQFAYCLTFYELLYGVHPFPDTSLPSTDLAQPEKSLYALGQRRPGPAIPRWLHRCVTRGLTGDPRARHVSMRTLCDVVERGLETRGRAQLTACVLTLVVVLGTATSLLQ